MHKLFKPAPKPAQRPFDLPHMAPESLAMCEDIYKLVIAAGRQMRFLRVGFHALPGTPGSGDGLCIATCNRGLLFFSDVGGPDGTFFFATRLFVNQPPAEVGEHWRFCNEGMQWYRDKAESQRHLDLMARYIALYLPQKSKQKPQRRGKNDDDSGAPPASFDMSFPSF